MITDPHYPYVACPRHGDWRTVGYCVCVHVAKDGAPIAHRIDATTAELGEVLCAACHTSPTEPPAEQLLLICALCVDEITRVEAPQ